MIQYVIWAMGAFAAYRLWGEVTWLAVIVVIIALSYEAHEDEQAYYQTHGEFPSSTAHRFMMTFITVLGVLIYSMFV